MLRKFILFLLNLALLALAGAAITAIWTEIVPTYLAEARVQVISPVPHPILSMEEKDASDRQLSFMASQAAILKSPAVLDRVLELPAIQETRWYLGNRISHMQRMFKLPTAPPMSRLNSHLDIQPLPEQEILAIVFRDPVPEDAQVILDAVVKAYLDISASEYQQEKAEFDRKLEDKHNMLSNEVATREVRLGQLQKLLGTLDPQAKLARMSSRLEATETRLVDIDLEIEMLSWKQQTIETLAKEGARLVNPGRAGVLKALLGIDNLDYAGALKIADIQRAQLQHERQLVATAVETQSSTYAKLMVDAQSLQKEIDDLDHHRAVLSAFQQRMDQRGLQVETSPVTLLSAASVSPKPRDLRIPFTAGVAAICLISIKISCMLLGTRKRR